MKGQYVRDQFCLGEWDTEGRPDRYELWKEQRMHNQRMKDFIQSSLKKEALRISRLKVRSANRSGEPNHQVKKEATNGS